MNTTNQWDASIADVLSRFSAILEEAKTASQPLVDATVSDLVALSRPWTALESQRHLHAEELEEAWEELSDALCDDDDVSEDLMDNEAKKRDQAVIELEVRYQRAYVQVMAQGAERLRAHALAADAKAFCCTHCGAGMERVAIVSQALNVACGYCNAVISLEPGQATRAFAAAGAHFLGELAALDAWEAQLRLRHVIDEYRNRKDVPLDALARYREAAETYWTARLGVEVEFVPEERQYLASRIERYMKDVDKELNKYWQWKNRAA